MRAMIEVKDLSPAQVSYVARNVPVTGRTFLPGLPRVCVGFELDEGVELHTEMDVVEFTGLMVALTGVGLRATAEAALVETSGEPDRLPWLPSAYQVRNLSAAEAAKLAEWGNAPCEHGSPVTVREASAFEGVPPVLTYADGCQSYGPYQGS